MGTVTNETGFDVSEVLTSDTHFTVKLCLCVLGLLCPLRPKVASEN